MSSTHNLTATPPKKQHGQLGYMAHYYDIVVALMTLGREKTLRRVTLDLVQLKPGDKVLEIGCGTGTLTLGAKVRVGAAGKAMGIDIAPEMVEAANRKAARKGVDASFQVGSIAKIPFPDSCFDAVMCSFMIFHMPADVRSEGLAEVYRVLRSGGRLSILDFGLPDKPWLRRFVQMHFGNMVQQDVRELIPILKENSFSSVEVVKAGFMGTWFLRGTAEKMQ
jgi:ubiquinone/menaquinone biosynthesis C-methylase UbiE